MFSNKFFNGLDVENLKIGGKLSPKILIVKPYAKIVHGNTTKGVRKFGKYIKEKQVLLEVLQTQKMIWKIFNEGDQIILKREERHRLIGLKDYAIVAEIWRHTDVGNPSDEDDIIRLKDDFGR